MLLCKIFSVFYDFHANVLCTLGGRMSKSKKYKIKQKDFRKLEKLAERIYNTVTVIDYFCRTQQEIEELYNLTPIIGYSRRDTDTVNTYLYCIFYLALI